jgi:hypothetical protein
MICKVSWKGSRRADVWRGCGENRIVFAHKWVAPCLIADRIPDSVSGKHQSDMERGDGDGFGVSIWM